jgi:polar amino acid transport system substrate-binding protein
MTNIKSRISNLKWILAVVALVALVGADVLTEEHPPLQQDKTWPEVQKSGVVRFGMDAGFLPFEGISASGEFVGLDVDLARELAARLGLRAEFVQIGADRFYDTLQAKQCEAVISALTPEAIRLRDFAYTDAYFDAGLVLVEPVTFKLENLKGRTLAVEVGSEGDVRARWLARRTVGLRVMERDTPGEAMQAVEAGLADGALTDTASARQYVAQHSALRIGARQTSSPYVIAVRRDSPDLLRALNQALAQVKTDGALEGIIARWLDQKPPASS